MISSPAIRLSIPTTVHSSGSKVEGEVLLDFRQLMEDKIEEVHVKLKGFARTSVKRDKTTHRETHPLINNMHRVWSRGSEYPAPGSDLLRHPFSFRLPDTLPPSFHYEGYNKSASVRYHVTAVGVRPGMFQTNRRIRTILVIFPKDEAGVQVRHAMPSIGFRTIRREEMMRRGLWGDYATARVEFSIPDVQTLPRLCDLPYQIKVITKTAPLTAAKAEAHPAGKPIFPSPPSEPTDVTFKLCQSVSIRARHFTASGESDIMYFLGDRPRAVEMETPDKVWTPLNTRDEKKEKGDLGEKGVWTQRVKLTSKMRITTPPSFATGLIRCEHFMVLQVPFPGIGNDVKIRVPVVISSGIDTSASIGPSVSNLSSGNVPSPTVDLPPAYWTVNDRDWDDLDDKD